MRSPRRGPWLGFIVLMGLGTAGCVVEPTTEAADVYVLEYTLVDLRGGQGRAAEPGHHCGDVERDQDTLTVWLWPGEDTPNGPWLAIFPELPDGWHAGFGAEPFKTDFPHDVDPGVQDDGTTLGRLEWEHATEGDIVRLDGEAVAVPHAWSVTAEDGSWRADAHLTAWRGEMDIDRYEGLCA